MNLIYSIHCFGTLFHTLHVRTPHVGRPQVQGRRSQSFLFLVKRIKCFLFIISILDLIKFEVIQWSLEHRASCGLSIFFIVLVGFLLLCSQEVILLLSLRLK
jgi:hypothetical protein